MALVAAKLVLVSAIGGIATYCAAKSAEHRRAQREPEFASRRLTAIRPFLRDVSDGKADEIIAMVAKEVFTRQIEPTDRKRRSRESPSSIAQVASLGQAAVEAIAKRQP